ncbi:MAG TPA: proton-conducting transporter membrane subunit, partial [Verrucomicrobiae bacterium]|nr:proton-conducting transporter membrane subunit [Verrucomicrobiae bacterium]
LSAVVLLLVGFLIAVISRFSIHYLAGDPGQGRFTKWLSLTGGSVLTVVLSGNLLQFTLAWCATSLCLHQLLVFYPGRPGAVLAARKKFLISRLGDGCLLGVLVLVHQTMSTWDFDEIFAIARRWHEAGTAGPRWEVTAICLLLVAGAMLKSAQFPFHSWLPDTMETPTPVSALMHAGIINAGGFLVIRLQPLLTLSPAALWVLALFGAFTALFASLVMLTHASVKRSLAFSTVAQMGFMMLECGMGVFSLALLHMVAHSLYKAHAFLRSGSIIALVKSGWAPTEKPNAHPLTLLASFVSAGGLCAGSAWVFGVNVRQEPSQFVLVCTFGMGLGYTLWSFWSRSIAWPRVAVGTVFGAGIAMAWCAQHKVFAELFGRHDWVNSPLMSFPGVALVAILLALFLLVLLLQTELPQWASHPLLQTLYVHARNGFYFNTLANRVVTWLWPLSPRPRSYDDERHAGT